MKKAFSTFILIALTLPAIATASEYSDFQKDINTPYGFYKKSIALTSKAKNKDKAIEITKNYIESWQQLATKYQADPPTPFKDRGDFSEKINRPVEVGKQALAQLNDNKVKQSHETLEEVRYILWQMRTEAGIVSLNDRINDFHEAMEIVLHGMKEDSSTKHLGHLNNRYGAWLTIKWTEVANSAAALDQSDLSSKVEEGFKAIKGLRHAMKTGDQELAKKQGKMVKKAYKEIFFLPICS